MCWWLGLALLAVLATAVRLPGLTGDGFWFDELLTAEYAAGGGDVTLHLPHDQWITPVPRPTELGRHPVWAIWTGLDGTVHPPLFYMAARGWASVFGATDVGYRSWSLTCSVAGVLVLAAIVCRLHGRKAGLVAGLLLALSAPQIYFGHDAKHYPQAQLTLLLAAWVAALGVASGRFTWARSALLAMLLTAAPLTHYFTIGAAVAIGGWAMWRSGDAWRRVVTCGVVAALVGGLAWLPQMLRARGHGFSTSLWVGDYDRLLPELTRQVGELPLGMLVHVENVPGLLLAVSWGLWLVPAVWAWRRRDAKLALWVGWFVVALTPALGASLWLGKEVIAYPRYTVFAAPALCALVAAGMPVTMRRFGDVGGAVARWIIPAAVVVLVTVELTRPYTRHMSDYKPLASHVVDASRPGDGLVVVVQPDDSLLHCGLFMAVTHYAGDDRFAELWLANQASPTLSTARVWVLTPYGSEGVEIDGYERVSVEGYPPVGSATLWRRATP
ncbi:MAG: glycosyltransferase family 39 protein [Planctomycetota bacterium]